MDTSKIPAAKDGEAAFAASGTCLITQGKNNAFLVTGGNDARVFRSTDRGKTWLVADTPIVKGTAGSGIFSIAMLNEKDGVIVGGNYEKPDEHTDNLAFTKDGGKSWGLGTGLNGYRSSVTLIEGQIVGGWILAAAGSSGSEISFDGGKSWQSYNKFNFNSVQLRKKTVWAVGPNGLVAKTWFDFIT